MKMFKQIWQKSEFRRTDFPKPFALMSMAWLSQKRRDRVAERDSLRQLSQACAWARRLLEERPGDENGHGHERVRVGAKEPLDDILQAVQFLDGFGERVEASGATRVCVPSFIVFLAVKIATLSSLLILLCAFV